jgi:hypothetical protein
VPALTPARPLRRGLRYLLLIAAESKLCSVPRRVWIVVIASLPLGSRLQLAFEFVEKTPIGAVACSKNIVGMGGPSRC